MFRKDVISFKRPKGKIMDGSLKAVGAHVVEGLYYDSDGAILR